MWNTLSIGPLRIVNQTEGAIHLGSMNINTNFKCDSTVDMYRNPLIFREEFCGSWCWVPDVYNLL